LALTFVGTRLRAGRPQGAWLAGGAAFGLLSLLGFGFAVERTGIGLGGATLLAALLVLLGAGAARLGRFRGDLFVGAAVVFCCCSSRCRSARRSSAPSSTTPARSRCRRLPSASPTSGSGACSAWWAACAAAWPGTRCSWRCSPPPAPP
jgi:hypothetical protein